MKKIVLLTTIALIVSACQPHTVNQVAQQQHFVCKSLIDGFLKTQHLASYQLDDLHPTLNQTASTRQYTYRTSSDYATKINVPKQQNLKFACEQTSAQHFQIKLLDNQSTVQQTLLSLDVPTRETIDTLTAFSLENQ